MLRIQRANNINMPFPTLSTFSPDALYNISLSPSPLTIPHHFLLPSYSQLHVPSTIEESKRKSYLTALAKFLNRAPDFHSADLLCYPTCAIYSLYL
jgi:hypothetical protein